MELGFGSVKIQSLICVQNWAVCGVFLLYFPQLCYNLSYLCFRHNLRQIPPCLSSSTQTHTDMASPEESGATFLPGKSPRGLWALQQATQGYLKTHSPVPSSPSSLSPSAVMECFWKLPFSQPVIFLFPPLIPLYKPRLYKSIYVSPPPGKNWGTLKRVHQLLSHWFHPTISEYWSSLWWQKSLSKI